MPLGFACIRAVRNFHAQVLGKSDNGELSDHLPLGGDLTFEGPELPSDI